MTAAEEPRGEPRDQQRTEVDSARERLIYLSDGVFAIAITLLVLEITLPQLPTEFAAQEQKLPGALFALWPQIATYALSFIIVSVYWTTHQRIFHYITRVDNVLIWLNILFLLSVAFLPVPTNVLGRYGDHGAAVRFYALSLMVTGLIIIALWWYATSSHRLVDKQLDTALIRHHQERSLIAPVILVLCIGLSYLNPYLAEASLLLIGVGIIVHEWFYRHRKGSWQR
ncbi:MAG: TMEM175 family protein [Ktedonobacterales bacterium]